MKSLVERYESWDELRKNLFILLVVAAFGALISVIFIFLDNIGVLFGWLLGSAVNIFAYWSIHQGSAYILSNSEKRSQGYLAILWGLLRFVLYAGCLVLSGLASFRWGSLSHGYCNLIACALALMPTWIMLVLVTLIRNNKSSQKTKEIPPEEEKKEDVTEEEE
ncbi:MAG: hypothetical protein K6E59_05905 [Bacilli bacterium]|nr:hypothetical protein [Bacilli bacterium]